MKIKIVVDSTAGLPEDYIIENNIEVVPLNVVIDGVSYLDGIDITLEEVMENFENGAKVTTSQPSPDVFQKTFNRLKEEGFTDIICLTISSTLSGTYNSALLAKSDVEGVNINVIDTLSASIGSEMLIREAVIKLNGGASITEIINHVEALKKNAVILINMENLNSLKKSGRITRIKAAIGNLIRVKPILEYIDGKLSIHSKFRTDKAIFAYVIERLAAELEKVKSKIHVYVSHVQAEERILQLKNKIEAVYNNIKVHVSRQITPVIAVNIGYGGIGVSWCYE